jgi:hypothetical protein
VLGGDVGHREGEVGSAGVVTGRVLPGPPRHHILHELQVVRAHSGRAAGDGELRDPQDGVGIADQRPRVVVVLVLAVHQIHAQEAGVEVDGAVQVADVEARVPDGCQHRSALRGLGSGDGLTLVERPT